MWFQQDGATCHTTQVNMALLQETFSGRVISCLSDINGPSRSCDLTPLDFFLWGYAKDCVYADKPSTLEHLKTKIRQVMNEITPNKYQKMVRKLLQKNQCMQHFALMLFKRCSVSRIISTFKLYNKKEISCRNMLYSFYLHLLLKPRNI